jgi:uncharacterized protein (DUF1330 family)
MRGDAMQIVNQVYPTAEQFMPLAADPNPEPIVMVNLLKFRDRAAYSDGRSDDLSGREAYLRYARKMVTIVTAAGGRVLFSGHLRGVIIGEVETAWDMVAVVEYPSRRVFQQLATSPDVQAIGVDREAGLAGQLLLLSTAQDPRELD